MTSELRRVLDFIYAHPIFLGGHIQNPMSGLAELEKLDKVALGRGLTWTGILRDLAHAQT